jgi:hypothetical protein
MNKMINQFQKRWISVIQCIVIAITIISGVNSADAAGLQIQTNVFLTMRHQPQLLAYKKPNPVVHRAQIAFASAGGGALTLGDYQWFHEGMPLALERHADIPLVPFTNVAITIDHAGPTPTFSEFKAECKGIANTIRRLSLEVFLKRARLATVNVPSQSATFPYDAFAEISQELKERGFVTGRPEDPLNVSSGVLIPLKSDNNSEFLVYQ